jgi:hypothetical protein
LADNLLLSNSSILGLTPATEYQYVNFRRWFDAMRPVVEEEEDFLRDPRDLIALGGPQREWLHQKLEEANFSIFTGEVRLTL